MLQFQNMIHHVSNITLCGALAELFILSCFHQILFAHLIIEVDPDQVQRRIQQNSKVSVKKAK